MSRELRGSLNIGRFMQCCGLDLGKDWDCFELCCPDEDLPERCTKPATCTYDNGIERIPLCPEHYDAWCRQEAEPGNGTSPVWWSQEWLEKYEDNLPNNTQQAAVNSGNDCHARLSAIFAICNSLNRERESFT
jgi:hypothetical protein